MRDFIKNEWKTLLATLLCVGSLFTYFYVTDPSPSKENVSDKRTCFIPGEALAGVHLGEASIDMRESFGKILEEKEYFDLRVEKRERGIIAYRGKALSALAIKRGYHEICDKEAQAWFKSRQPIGALRFSEGETWTLYDGAADMIIGEEHYTSVRHDLH